MEKAKQIENERMSEITLNGDDDFNFDTSDDTSFQYDCHLSDTDDNVLNLPFEIIVLVILVTYTFMMV